MSTELATPGASVDLDLLDGAVAFINRATHANGLPLAGTIGTYLVDTFFGGLAGREQSWDA